MKLEKAMGIVRDYCMNRSSCDDCVFNNAGKCEASLFKLSHLELKELLNFIEEYTKKVDKY